MIRYFLYARKSTDDEERQVLSIDAQLAELREFARKENLVVVAEFLESKTAKTPGRPVFNAMLQRIQAGEAQGILAWHPDRLARNSVDGGQIIYLLDTGQLLSLKCPTFWFEPTPQGKFMLSIAFGQSKYYVDNLRENILRGIRQKLRRGELPGKAPLGYLNEPRLRTIVLDEGRAPLVKRLFEAYATGRYTVLELRELVTQWGLRTREGRDLSRTNLWYILGNPFYTGVFRLNGEVYEGSHPPLITQDLFDRVQARLQERDKPRYKTRAPFAFLGLLRCGECGCAITAQRQKGHHYYRCTKMRGPCKQPYVREEALAEQLRAIVAQVAMPDGWAPKILSQFDRWGRQEQQRSQFARQAIEAELVEVTRKLERLLDAHLDNVLTREEYLGRKEALLHQKAELKAKLAEPGGVGTGWLEPAKRFVEASRHAAVMAQSENLAELANFLRSTDSNLTLAARQPHGEWGFPWSLLAKRGGRSNWWSFLRGAQTHCRRNGAPQAPA